MNIMFKDPPPVRRDSYYALERQYGARNYKPFDVVLTRGLGVWVWDIDGRRYLDCLAAYSAVTASVIHRPHANPSSLPRSPACPHSLDAALAQSRTIA